MKPPLLLIFALLAGTGVGCSSSDRDLRVREPYVKPGLIMLTADQAERRGLAWAERDAADVAQPANVAAADASAVVVPAAVKAYPVGRSVDATDRELLHEAHVVYRREKAPAWRLGAPATQQILVGPRVTDTRQELQPIVSAELTAFLAEQRRATRENQKAIAALFEAVNALATRVQGQPGPDAGPVEPASPTVGDGSSETVKKGKKN